MKSVSRQILNQYNSSSSSTSLSNPFSSPSSQSHHPTRVHYSMKLFINTEKKRIEKQSNPTAELAFHRHGTCILSIYHRIHRHPIKIYPIRTLKQHRPANRQRILTSPEKRLALLKQKSLEQPESYQIEKLSPPWHACPTLVRLSEQVDSASRTKRRTSTSKRVSPPR